MVRTATVFRDWATPYCRETMPEYPGGEFLGQGVPLRSWTG